MKSPKFLNSLGGVLAVLGIACPVCIPAIAGVLASAGLLIIASSILKPLFWIMLGLFWFGLVWSYRRHGNITPVILGILFGIATYWVRYVWYYRVAATEVIAWYDWRIMMPAIALLGVAVWNQILDTQNGICDVPIKK